MSKLLEVLYNGLRQTITLIYPLGRERRRDPRIYGSKDLRRTMVADALTVKRYIYDRYFKLAEIGKYLICPPAGPASYHRLTTESLVSTLDNLSAGRYIDRNGSKSRCQTPPMFFPEEG